MISRLSALLKRHFLEMKLKKYNNSRGRTLCLQNIITESSVESMRLLYFSTLIHTSSILAPAFAEDENGFLDVTFISCFRL